MGVNLSEPWRRTLKPLALTGKRLRKPCTRRRRIGVPTNTPLCRTTIVAIDLAESLVLHSFQGQPSVHRGRREGSRSNSEFLTYPNAGWATTLFFAQGSF